VDFGNCNSLDELLVSSSLFPLANAVLKLKNGFLRHESTCPKVQMTCERWLRKPSKKRGIPLLSPLPLVAFCRSHD